MLIRKEEICIKKIITKIQINKDHKSQYKTKIYTQNFLRKISNFKVKKDHPITLMLINKGHKIVFLPIPLDKTNRFQLKVSLK